MRKPSIRNIKAAVGASALTAFEPVAIIGAKAKSSASNVRENYRENKAYIEDQHVARAAKATEKERVDAINKAADIISNITPEAMVDAFGPK